MSAVFGVSALLVACVLGHVAATNLRILSITRADSVDPVSFNFSIHYQAPERPACRWKAQTYIGTTLYDGIVSHHGDEGTAYLVVAKKDLFFLSTEFGGSNLLQHFLLVWRIDMRPVRLDHEINLPASEVTPGTNVTYTKGHRTNVEVRWSEEGVNGVSSEEGGVVTLLGTYLDPATERVRSFMSHQEMEFLQMTVTSAEYTTTNAFTFLTDQFPINGYFEASLRYSVLDGSTSPLTRIEERIKLLVHEDTNEGPFPNDGVYADFMTKDPTCSSSGCAILCNCFTNDVHRYKLQIVKVEPNGRVSIMTTSTDINPRLQVLNTGLFVHGKDGAGRYVCQALNKDTRHLAALASTTVTMT